METNDIGLSEIFLKAMWNFFLVLLSKRISLMYVPPIDTYFLYDSVVIKMSASKFKKAFIGKQEKYVSNDISWQTYYYGR